MSSCNCYDPCAPTPAGPKGVSVSTVKWNVVPNSGDNVGKDGVTIQPITYYDDPSIAPSLGNAFFVPSIPGAPGKDGAVGPTGPRGSSGVSMLALSINKDDGKVYIPNGYNAGDILNVLIVDNSPIPTTPTQESIPVGAKVLDVWSVVIGGAATLQDNIKGAQGIQGFGVIPLKKNDDGNAYIPDQFAGQSVLFLVGVDSPYPTDKTTSWIGNADIGDFWQVNAQAGQYNKVINAIGPTGAQGPQGPAGAAGSTVTNIENTLDDNNNLKTSITQNTGNPVTSSALKLPFLPLTGGVVSGNTIITGGGIGYSNTLRVQDQADAANGAFIQMQGASPGSYKAVFGLQTAAGFKTLNLNDSGALGLAGDPIGDMDATTKQYVDNAVKNAGGNGDGGSPSTPVSTGERLVMFAPGAKGTFALGGITATVDYTSNDAHDITVSGKGAMYIQEPDGDLMTTPIYKLPQTLTPYVPDTTSANVVLLDEQFNVVGKLRYLVVALEKDATPNLYVFLPSDATVTGDSPVQIATSLPTD